MEWLEYLLYGGGRWMNRWHCSGMDVGAFATSLITTLSMYVTYLIYAWQNNRALRFIKNSWFRRHLIDLRNVFVVCGTIHLVSCVLSWWVPLYYVASLMMLINTVQMIFLILVKRHVLAIQEYTNGREASEQIEEIFAVIRVAQASRLSDKLETLFEELKDIKAKKTGDANDGEVRFIDR